jgi:hypothetical protein
VDVYKNPHRVEDPTVGLATAVIATLLLKQAGTVQHGRAI